MLRIIITFTAFLLLGSSSSFACCGESHDTKAESSCSCNGKSSCGEAKEIKEESGCKGGCGCSECKKAGCQESGCGCSKSSCQGAATRDQEGSCKCAHMNSKAQYSECEHHSTRGEFHVAKNNACTGDVDCCCWGGECLGGDSCCKRITCKK